jgi:ankyrin repeat protein
MQRLVRPALAAASFVAAAGMPRRAALAEGAVAPSLHALASSSDAAALRRALESLATPPVEARRDGLTPLMVAAMVGDAAAVRELVRKGASVAARSESGAHVTALMMAAANGHDDAVIALVEGGADVEAIDDFGEAALGYAARYGHKMTMSMLMQRGALLEQGNDYYGMRWGNLDHGRPKPNVDLPYYGLKKTNASAAP